MTYSTLLGNKPDKVEMDTNAIKLGDCQADKKIKFHSWPTRIQRKLSPDIATDPDGPKMDRPRDELRGIDHFKGVLICHPSLQHPGL